MTEYLLQFELEEGADADALAAQLRQRLDQMSGIEEADAEVQDMRFGVAETVTIIAASIVIIKHSKDLIDELTGLVKSLDGLKSAVVDLRGKKVPIEALPEG